MIKIIKKMLKDDSGLACILPNWISACASVTGCMATLGDICASNIVIPIIDGCITCVEAITGLTGSLEFCAIETLLRCFGK